MDSPSTPLQPVKPDLFVSHREIIARNQLMGAIRRKIVERKLKTTQILHRNRPILTSERARILRGEYENFSLRRAFLIADSVGVDNVTLMRALIPAAMEEDLPPFEMPELPEVQGA